MAEQRVTMRVLLDQDGSMRRSYGITSYPTAVIVDQQGVVRQTNVGWGGASLRELTALVGRMCPK